MDLVRDFAATLEAGKGEVGSKAWSLAFLHNHGIAVPAGLSITKDAYLEYVARTGVRERVLIELNRKPFSGMRWEELWDAALRIRNMFLRTPIPKDLRDVLASAAGSFGDRPVAVRSSAPGEDSAGTSFAGLHESYVNVRGTDEILKHVRLVWASLWNDAALLYRQELGLDVQSSAMAVLIQELVVGDRSGVVFSRSPTDESQAVVESVYGLNQGMVDGTVEPDRWLVDRATRRIVSHHPVRRSEAVAMAEAGEEHRPLRAETSARPPLGDEEVLNVFDLAMRLEQIHAGPQDVEWTYRDGCLVTLQARPITASTAAPGTDKRTWYRSLSRSFDNLKKLRVRIETDILPGMLEAAASMAAREVNGLADADLSVEIERRRAIHQHWVDVYWDDLIPFAHGARLFGQLYNDAVQPADPHEFVDLLAATKMTSLQRNESLEALAAMLRADAGLSDALRAGRHDEVGADFAESLKQFVGRFGDLASPIIVQADDAAFPAGLVHLLLEMAQGPARETRARARDVDRLTRQFLARFEGSERKRATEILDLARTSYRLRDDDNIYLQGVETQMQAAAAEGRRRLAGAGVAGTEMLSPEDVGKALLDPTGFTRHEDGKPTVETSAIRARQLIGQPAGPGVATGRARVVGGHEDLLHFEQGEVLVVDTVDPTMTFVIPLAAAIVERRGGMLIHGAIIAREYGIPCVTGVEDAATAIPDGSRLTVDGYLGIVRVAHED